jgi:hypothetical protein
MQTGSPIVTVVRIEEGNEAFVTDGEGAIGAVRGISRNGKGEVTIYVENAGDFQVPGSSIEAVHSQR